MNALEMKLIAMKFALARREHIPNDKKFTSSSGAYDVGSIQQQLSQGVVIDDRDLTINNTIVEDCEHEANVTTTQSPEPTQPTTSEAVAEPETVPVEVVPPETSEIISTTTTIPESVPQPTTEAQPLGFGGRIWQYFKETGNGQPKS